MAETVVTIASGQSLDRDAQLPGNAPIAAIKVDAPKGSCWVNFPDVGRSVAPGTMGAVIPYRLQTSRLHVTTDPPPGQQNPTAGLSVTLTVSDQSLTDVSGVSAPLITKDYAVKTVTVAFNSPVTQVPLGFTANSILVENPGGQWIVVNDGQVGRVIPPYTTGVVFALPFGITTGTYFSNFPPAGQTNTGTGFTGTIEWTEEILSPSSGVNLVQALSASTGQALIVANALGGPAAASPTFAFSFTVPSGNWKLAGLTLGLNGFVTTAATTPVFGYLYTVTINGALVFATNRALYDNSAIPLAPPDGVEYNFPQAITIAGGATIQGTIGCLGGTFNATGCTVNVVFFLIPALV